MKIVKYLVVNADGEVRIVAGKRMPLKLAWSEVAYKIIIDMPESWGTIRGDITLTMPEAPDRPEVVLVEDAK